MSTYVVPLATSLGEPVPIADLTDPLVRANLDELAAQGIVTARVSMKDSAVLAALATPPGLEVDAVIVSCDSVGACDGPSDWVRRYRAEAGLDDVRVLYVGGEACANFAAAIDVAGGLFATGKAEKVLWVTADRVVTGTRFPPMSATVFSDGAASCLLAMAPTGPAFEVLGTATHRWKTPDGGLNKLAYARGALTSARVVGRALALPDGIDHLLAPNFGSATRKLLAMAVPVPAGRLHSGVVAEVGHCFAADTLLNLDDLRRRGPLRDGDTVLALVSSDTTMSGVLMSCSGVGSLAGTQGVSHDHDEI